MTIKYLKRSKEILLFLNILNSKSLDSQNIDLLSLQEILKKSFLISLYSEFEYYLLEIIFNSFSDFESRKYLFKALKMKIKNLDFEGLRKLLKILGGDGINLDRDFKEWLSYMEDEELKRRLNSLNPKEDIRWNDFIMERNHIAHNQFEFSRSTREFTEENLKIILYFAEYILQTVEELSK